jgi:hypothetical protein
MVFALHFFQVERQRLVRRDGRRCLYCRDAKRQAFHFHEVVRDCPAAARLVLSGVPILQEFVAVALVESAQLFQQPDCLAHSLVLVVLPGDQQPLVRGGQGLSE